MNLFEILPNRLYQSGAVDNWSACAAAGITAVVDLEPPFDTGIPQEPNKIFYLYWPIVDGPLPHLPDLQTVAETVLWWLHRKHRVLVHCTAGINRSSLVNGLVLHRLHDLDYGLPLHGADLVAYIRAKRPGALSNELFASFLSALP